MDDGARAAIGRAHPRTQIREIQVGVDDLALEGLGVRRVVANVVEGDPAASKVRVLTEITELVALTRNTW